jgi:hypothetical protein
MMNEDGTENSMDTDDYSYNVVSRITF